MERMLVASIVGILVAGAVSAANLDGYSVTLLSSGLNSINFAGPATRGIIVMARRENFNAHSFDVATFYLTKVGGDGALSIVGLWNSEKEELYTTVTGGADCTLHDFRLLTRPAGGSPLLVRADRDSGDSFVARAKVTFRIYDLKSNDKSEPGRPAWYFDLVETRHAAANYCDVESALSNELGLGASRRPSNQRLERP